MKVLTAAVLIPTYRRPLDLECCLYAIDKQLYQPLEVIVIARQGDDEKTWGILERFTHKLPLKIVPIAVPGVVQALNAGLTAVTADIVAITDDDAVPHEDWLQRIVSIFAENHGCAGVGGRDIMHVGERIVEGKSKDVGLVPRLGRMSGNHHRGYGEARVVDVLKGVNGAYRTEILRAFPPDLRLRGGGAQVHWEVGIGLAMRTAGYTLIYDPAILVDHYLAQRFDEDQRHRFNPIAQRNEAFNEYFIRLQYLHPLERILQVSWGIVIGTRACPGILQGLRLFPMQGRAVIGQVVSSVCGIWDALQCQK